MAAPPYSTDTLEIKALIYQKLGHEKADVYFHHLTRFFSFVMEKTEFDNLCIDTIGREHIYLHNRLMQSILKYSTCSTNVPPTKLESSLSNSVRKSRSPIKRSSRFRGHGPSPLGPYAKDLAPSKLSDYTSPMGPLAKTPCATINGGGPVVEEDNGEDEVVELITLPRPITEPLGISVKPIARKTNNVEICTNGRVVPDTRLLMSRLEKVMEEKGLGISNDYSDLLNKALRVYLNRLIKPSVVSARSRCIGEKSQPCFGSMEDLLASVDTQPKILGADWPRKLEKVSLSAMLAIENLRRKK